MRIVPNYKEITTVNFEQANNWEIYPCYFTTFERLKAFCDSLPQVPEGALRTVLSQISATKNQSKKMWSYGHKHLVEKYSEHVLKNPVYCSNSGFIVAAVQMGFKAYPVIDFNRYNSFGGINWHFNFRWEDIKALQDQIERARR